MIDTPARGLLNDQLRPTGAHSQQWLANTLGIGQSSVSNWTRGIARPEHHHRVALRILLGIPETSWMTEDELSTIERVRAMVQQVPALAKARKRPTRRPAAA